MRVNLIGGDQKAMSVAINNQLTQNMYAVPAPGSPSGAALVSAPGTTRVAAISAPCRGLHVMAGQLYGVFGDRLYRFDSGLQATDLGEIPGDARVGMADDGTSLVIVTGIDRPGFVFSGALAQITDPDFPGANSVDYTGGYFLFSYTEGQWFISELNSPTSFNALDFATNTKAPDDILRVVEDHGEVFCFGEWTTQVWFHSGNADFPFEISASAQIERGTYARWSVAKDDNTLFFLGDDLIVYRMNGYTPARVSDEGVEAELSDYLKAGHEADLRNAWAYTYSDHGHKFYVLTVPNRGTHVYDLSTQQWHSRKHYHYATHHSAAYARCYGKHFVGGIDGHLYELTRSVYSDDGAPLVRKRRTAVFSMDDRRIRYKEIKFVVDTGTALAHGHGSDPHLMVKWSGDYGRSWSNERLLSIGEQGQYVKTVATRHCGSDRRRVIEVSFSEPVSFTLTDCFVVVA